MKARNIIFTAILAIIALAACNNDDEGTNPSTSKKAVLFNTGISTLRMSGTTWDAGDKIGITMVETGTTTVKDSMQNKQYETATGAAQFTAITGNEVYYPANNSAVDFHAYYPYVAGLTDTYNVNVTNQTNQSNIDLLYANAVNKTADVPTVTVQFSHQLVKVVLNIVGNNIPSLAGATVHLDGIPTTATFNLLNGTLSRGSNVTTINALTAANGRSAEAIVLPVAGTGHSVAVRLGNDVYRTSFPDAFVAGHRYTYTVTLMGEEISLELTSNITNWNEGNPDGNVSAEKNDYTLIWHDEFDTDGAPDNTKWTFENGFVRNRELQWYQANNAICKDGFLVISGKKERVANPNYVAGSSDWTQNREYAEYTSTSMTTQGKMAYTFGRLEVRAKIPTQTGSWPAIWLLGTVGDWPFNGEIDVLEYYLINGTPRIHANFCWGGTSRWDSKWDSYNEPFTNFTNKNSNWANEFHVWTYEWDEEMSRFYIDGELFREVWTNSMWNGGGHTYIDPQTGETKVDWRNPFHSSQYILLNLAIGAQGGTPDDSAFPLKYEIDYVRVYQKTGS